MVTTPFWYFRSSDRLETGTIGFLALVLVLKVNSEVPSFNRFDVRAKTNASLCKFDFLLQV